MLNTQNFQLFHVPTQHSTGLEISLNSNCQRCCSVTCPWRAGCMLLHWTTCFTKIKLLISALQGGRGLLSRSSSRTKITASVNLLQAVKQTSTLHLQGGNDSSSLPPLHQPILPMHIYEQFQQKIAFSGPCLPLMCSRGKIAVWEGSTFHDLPGRKCERFPGAAAYLPVTWSTRMREVIMRPYWEKSCSNSFWVIVFGSPLTYRFASLIEAELGRA